MNTLVTHTAPAHFFADTFTSVQTVTDEGAPVTIGTIYHNKHGRTNLTGVGSYGRFVAGGTSKRDVFAFAKRDFTMAMDKKCFIVRGRLQEV